MEKYFEINENNLSIKCKIYCNDVRNVKNVIVSCHGFGGSKENAASKKLADKVLASYDDTAVITFDWPCHGKDVRQKLSLTDCNNYMATVLNYICSTFTTKKNDAGTCYLIASIGNLEIYSCTQSYYLKKLD